MTFFDWDDKYLVNIKEIDNQHKKFVKLINQFYDALLSNEYNLNSMFNNIIKYADNHFATEEKYFDQFNYIHTDEHKLEHNHIRTKLKRIESEIYKNNAASSLDFLAFLEDWLKNHFIIHDQKFIIIFKDNGLT